MDPDHIEPVMEHAQIIQIGARNMANFSLLKRVGAAIRGTDHGVVLKRGFSATVEEWLLAAEYVTSEGGDNAVLVRAGYPHVRDLYALHFGPLGGGSWPRG